MFDGAQRVAELFRRYSPLLPSRVPSCSSDRRQHDRPAPFADRCAWRHDCSQSPVIGVIEHHGNLVVLAVGTLKALVRWLRLRPSAAPPPPPPYLHPQSFRIYRRHHTSPQASRTNRPNSVESAILKLGQYGVQWDICYGGQIAERMSVI